MLGLAAWPSHGAFDLGTSWEKWGRYEKQKQQQKNTIIYMLWTIV